jgi:hypothetical protein
MTSMTANLAPAQRRLMNVLYDHHDARGMNARRAKMAASVDHDEVVGLALADLIEAFRGDHRMDVVASGSIALYVGGPIMRLTNHGIRWCSENPLNKLLRAIDAAPRGRYDLRDASHDCDDDAVIVGAWSDGYATLHFKGDGRETKFVGNGREQFAHGGDFVLIPTSKIRTVLGPKA